MLSNLPFYLRFAAAAVATGVVFVVGSLLLGAGLTGAIDGLFLLGTASALVAALFTRPSVFRRRSIRESMEEDDANGTEPDEASPPVPDDDRDPRRQIRIGIGLIVFTAVSLGLSATLHVVSSSVPA